VLQLELRVRFIGAEESQDAVALQHAERLENYSRVTMEVLCVLPCLLKSYMNCYRKVPLRYLASLANSIALENSATYSMRCLVAEERPVVIISMSMIPVSFLTHSTTFWS